MRIVEASFRILGDIDGDAILKHLERCGRVCYKSEDKITDDSAAAFVRSVIKRGHESVIEHVSVTANIVADRGVTHELVRHRLASYSQESSRYCNYSSGKFDHEITVVKPGFYNENSPEFELWESACKYSEISLSLSAET